MAVSAQEETAVLERRVTEKSLSLLWCVTSALLLKIARENHRGETRRDDESQGAGRKLLKVNSLLLKTSTLASPFT